MIKTRIRCPVCGFRLNEDSFDREIELGDGNDIIEQSFGGRGSIETVGSYDFDDDEITRELFERVKNAYEYLAEILGIDDDDEPD